MSATNRTEAERLVNAVDVAFEAARNDGGAQWKQETDLAALQLELGMALVHAVLAIGDGKAEL